jgi:hypothetical protein
LRTTTRVLLVVLGGLLVGAGLQGSAVANHGPSCSILSGATVQQGGTLSVTAAVGPAQAANSDGQFHELRISGAGIGNAVADNLGHFNVSGTVPANHTLGIFAVDVVRISGPAPGHTVPCGNVEVVAAPDPTPTPTPTPDPTPAPTAPPAPPAAPAPPAPPLPAQQQQQQQQQTVEVVPAAVQAPAPAPRASGASLPKTGPGFDVSGFTNAGIGSLLIGAALADFARRRRKQGVEAATAVGSPDGPPHPELSEADLLLPYER